VELNAPRSAGHVVIGGGVLGLSAARRLAERGADVVVLDKGRVGSGASGIAGGIVRNYYRSAAISEVIRLSVELFEAEPEAYGFHQVGYAAAVPEAQVDDLKAIRDHHERVGYESELILGAERCREYLAWTWPDWEAEVEAVLHERRGGWADAMQTVRHLAARARDAGATIEEGTEVTGFELGSDGVESVLTSRGTVACGSVLAAPGPWAARIWAQLGQAAEVEIARNGDRERRPLFSYLKAQEGEFALPGVGLAGSAGHEAPVVHLDQAGPLVSDRDGRTLVDGPWGIYFRMGHTGAGITGGGLPVALGDPALDPYGSDNPAHAAEPSFGEFFTSGLAAAIRRFRGRSGEWRQTSAGGIVMHTPDDYPICERVLPNAYAIIDSGHGFKMLALGRLAADDLLDGEQPLLDPFRLGRFERGETHVASKGPYPWT
jgi:glycine/D-amino acid oxidase-like deaminating enzyme